MLRLAQASTVLTKDLLRVSRAGGGYHPRFVGDDPAARELAARVLGTFQGHVDEQRATLEAALTGLERDASDFKLVRGFAKLLEREATFETRAPLDPERARRAAFEAGESVGVVTEAERETALARAGDRLDASADAVAESFYADLEARQVLTSFEPRYDPESLVAQYDLSLAATALFDATAVRVRSSEPKALISAVKRLRLMYEIRRVPDAERDAGPGDREVIVTGPATPFSRSRRYGTRFARLLRTVATAPDWQLTATVDDRGTERELRLDDDDITVPGTEPVTEPTYDSGVEREFATRFESLDLDWDLIREPEPLAAGAHVVIPDFAFDYRHADFRVFFEIMGFWTPEYVEKKLSRLAELEDVAMLVAVDESLGVGEAVDQLTDGAIPYRRSVRVKDVVDALREYETALVDRAAASLPETVVPDADVITLADLAGEYGVSVAALAEKTFPEHERIGRTLVRPAVLERIDERVDAGMALEEVNAALATVGLDGASAVLAELGYRVEWEGLGGGTIRKK